MSLWGLPDPKVLRTCLVTRLPCMRQAGYLFTDNIDLNKEIVYTTKSEKYLTYLKEQL